MEMNNPADRLTRRDFLKLSLGAGTALAAMGLPLPFGMREASAEEIRELLGVDYSRGTWIPSACNMCGGQSGIRVLVQEGVARKIEPNPENPIGVANISTTYQAVKGTRGGKLCVKGNCGTMSLYDPDRLKTPVIRVGARGGNQWRSVSWEEGIAYAAEKLQQLKANSGAESVLWFSEDHSFTNIQADFMAAFGSPNYMNHSNLCDVARKVGFLAVVGNDRPLPDFEHAKYVLLFGWNPLGATKWSHLPITIIEGMITNGAKMVVVDPYLSSTAAKATEWVPLRPGTDGALALAMANVIISEQLYDEPFVTTWTVGFEQFSDYVKDKTPEWGERITSVPANQIRTLARELATTKPAVIDAWSGPGHHSNGTQGTRAIASLIALTGNYDVPGSQIEPTRKGSKRRAAPAEWPHITAKRVDGKGGMYPLGHGSGIYIQAREALLSGQPYQPKGAVVVFQNLMMSLPNRQKTREALAKLEFLMVVDTHLSETAELADIVFPGTNYLERYDFTGNWVTFPSVSLRQPVVKSWVNGMSEAELTMALARKLGLPGFEMTYEQYLSDELKAGIGITLDELKALPGAVWVSGETKYRKYAGAVTVPEGGSIDAASGLIKDKDGKAVGVRLADESLKRGFATASRKAEFYTAKYKELGYDPLPAYTETDEPTSSAYPLYMVSWKEAEHTHSRTFNNVWLMEAKPINPLQVNTATARSLGLVEGDEVWVESAYGKGKAQVHLTEGIHPEVVGLQHGFGHWAKALNVAQGKGTDDAQFAAGKAERISGQAITKEIAVKVYRA